MLAGHLKQPLYDAAKRSRDAWGIVAEDSDEAPAKALAKALEDGGFPCLVLPANLVEELPSPESAAAMEFDADGLALVNKAGERSLVLWSRVAMIAAAAFKEITAKKVKTGGPSLIAKAASLGLMAAGIPIRIGGKKGETEKVVETSELVYYLDLFERKPVRRFRVDAQDFNYACLGGRMKYAATDNFRSLVEDIASRAGRASLNRGARVLVKGEPVSAMGYDSLANLERESRWLMTLASLSDP
ncbi:MAG: hypothetical protein HY924_16680 [Elusimicrobia bacterium]|nr:hypothetical protein [Elusimicrobiota bacterium]